MDRLRLDFGQRSYDIVFSDSFSALTDEVKALFSGGKALLVTDSNVDRLYAAEVLNRLSDAGLDVKKFVFEAGEKSKNIDVCQSIYLACLKHNMDRGSFIVALGGGVVGDMAGFAAATFMRGIKFVQIPTTLLAQTDSSVGGKVGIDFGGVKNIIGAFKQPSLVYINSKTLSTLPKREFIAGMAEVIKYGIIYDSTFFEYLEENVCKAKQLDTEAIRHILYQCCKIKADVVMKDETEQSLRSILNFGHTIGHGIESAMNFKLLHGECVAVGMVGACKIALARSYFKESDFKRVVSLLNAYGLPAAVSGAGRDDIFKFMHSDKKKTGSNLKFILPKAIGRVEQFYDITDKEIKLGIDYILK